MGLKDIFHSMEDKWYSLLDRLDEKVPVYKVIDPIDRVAPSLAIFLGMIALLIIGFGILPLFGGTDVVVGFSTPEGEPISGLTVSAEWGSTSKDTVTNSVGKIVLKGIPLGSTLTLRVEDSQYESFSRTQKIEGNNPILAFTLSPRVLPPSQLSFQFVDGGGISLDGKELQVRLACSSGAVLPQSIYVVRNGVLTLTPPAGCGTLMGSVSGNGMTTQEGILFSGDNPIIRLLGMSSEKGKIKITVRTLEEDVILPDMDVELFAREGIPAGQTFTTNAFGVVIFDDTPVGTYYVSARDPAGNYALATSAPFDVSANQTVSVDVGMGRQVQGTLRVSVTDRTTNAWVANATIKLVRKSDNQLLATQLTPSGNNPVTLSVNERGPFMLYAIHPDYLSESKEINSVSGDQTVSFALEKLTPQNSGKITVNAKDEDGLPVDNAQVLLYDAASGFIAQAYLPRITDSNGNARFQGVQSGNYFARATKYPAGPSDSPNFTTDKSIPANANIVLTLGQATVQVSVKDVDGNPIPFARVEFRTDGTDECLPGKCAVQTDVQGLTSKSFKADRKIYVKASANGYSSFTSLSHQLYPGIATGITAKLPVTILGNSPKIVLSGIQDPVTGLSAAEVKSGKTYRAVFQLQIPSALDDLDGGGAHIRVGDEAFLENDALQITGVAAPETAALKGTSYQPALGYTADQENLTNGNAKWVNLQWNTLEPGTYEIGVLIRVDTQATPLQSLPVYYRAWGIRDSEWLRDPVDAVLGTGSSVAGRDGQYAETYQQIYYNGKPIVCNETFCYSGERILNRDDTLLVDGPPFPLSINKTYTYSFVLSSNAQTIYTNPRLRVFTSANAITPSNQAQFTAYRVSGTSGQPLQGSGLSVNDIPGGEGQGLDVGRMEQFRTITGEFDFLTKQNGATNLVVQLISDGDIVFQQIAPLAIASDQTLNIGVNPNTASAFIPTTFDVHVTNERGFDIQDARVSLLKIDPNQNRQIITQQNTDIAGKTTIIAPSSLPRTHFVFDAVKGGYASTPVTIVVDENVAAFEPRQLAFTLPNSPNAEQFLPLDITNITQQNMVITRAVITGNFQGILSNGEMQNWVNQYAGITTIPRLETKTIQIKASTSPSVNLVSGKTLRGSVLLTMRAQGSQQEWVQVVPFTVQIRVVSACDGEAIQLSGTPANGMLETSAFDARTQTPFQIANICQVDERGYPLKNLKAKVNWKSNPIGNVELSVTEIAGNNNTTVVLRNGSFVPLYEGFKTVDDSVYESILTFTPFPGHIGETAEFTITIAAEAGANNAPTTITKTFDMKIKITNFETCIKFTPEPEEGITIPADKDEGTFEINTSACGTIPVDIQFCNGANNSNCSGGAPEGRLYLSQFAINNLVGSKTIKIERKAGTLPGSYDLTVDARVPGTSLRRIASLNVKVESDLSYAFDIEKTDYSLYQRGAKDSSSVINRLLVEPVKVKANVCDWEDAIDKGLNITGTNAAIGIAVGQGLAILASGTSLISGPILAGLGFCWVCAGAAIAITLILSLLDDPCSDMATNTLTDYVINLAGGTDAQLIPPDAINIRLSPNISQDVSAEWVTMASNVYTKGGMAYQTVGLVVENLLGFSNPNPLFGVMTLKARVHNNGDPTHSGNASVTCTNGNFANYNIGQGPTQGSCRPASDIETREEKFHVKFRTQDLNQSLPNLTFDSVACVSGTTLGATGNGTLPRVAFNWQWNETTGIPINACDASNPNSIYCDATQLNISIMKRINALNGFLAANNYTFTCPQDPSAQAGSFSYTNPDPIAQGFIGITGGGYSFANPTTMNFTSTIANNTLTSQTGQILVTMTPIEDTTNGGNTGTHTPRTCTASTSITPNGTATASCTITNVEPIRYRVRYDLTSTTTSSIAYQSTVLVVDAESYSTQSRGTCENLPKTTAIVGGSPAINAWIDISDPRLGQYVRDTNVIFTTSVPNVQALNELMHFDAYLIRDGYSHDFENDFRDYYTTNAFADAPGWFKGSAGAAGLNRFYGENDKLVFSNKYFNDSTLPAPGKYRVDIGVFFGEEWKIMDTNGETRATIGVDFYHLENPNPNSPFYKLPFDGQVGLVNTTYERVGYGLEYINENAPIKVNDGIVQTQSGSGSTALGQVNVSQRSDLRTLNSMPSTRGNLLEVSAAAGSANQSIVFTPSLATPVMMKVTHAASTQPFSAFYSISTNGSPEDTGNTLTYWEGAGNCYDYTGVPIYERFNFAPDRAANPQDRLGSWQYSYGIDWPQAFVGGDAYLRTILYTPANGGTYAIQSEGGSPARFFTSNRSQPSTSQTLDGISTLPYNNASQVIDSLQDVFDLVGDRKICLTNSGAKTRFFWNPQTLYQQTSQTSITAAGNLLVAGQTCLGRPPQ